MQRRLIAAIAAVILAGIGAILLFNYVANADKRAMEALEPTPVLVVTDPIAPGTPGTEIAAHVTLQNLPKVAIVPGSLTSLDSILKMTATTAIATGEQLLPSRFAEAGKAADGSISVPADSQLVTVQLETQRAAGGIVDAGDKVGVFVTIDDTTTQLLKDVLVFSPKQQNASGLVTVALKPTDAQRLILASEGGKVWLVKEAKNPSTTSPLTMKDLER